MAQQLGSIYSAEDFRTTSLLLDNNHLSQLESINPLSCVFTSLQNGKFIYFT